jgi:WD40 repeat protein
MLPGVPGDVVVWDTSRLERLHTYHGHKAMVRSVCFAPDGKTLASSSDDMTVRLWKVE